MIKTKVYGYEMALVSEVYLSTLSSIMTPQGLERNFFPLLYLCEHSGDITQNNLAEAIRRNKVTTMRIVDYLCENGFLNRKQDCNDRRCHLLEVTDKAKKTVPKIKAAIIETEELLFHDFSAEEKQCLKVGMDKLITTINTLPDPDYIVKAVKRNKN